MLKNLFICLKMEVDDIIYLCMLIFTIVFGYYFRRLSNKFPKKWVSTVIGFSIVLFVSGIHIFHTIFCTLINSFIILYTSKRKCHIYSFFFSFLYLTFFRTTVYFGIPYPPAHTNLVQMVLTLKLVGLAFEIHDSYADISTKERSEKEVQKKPHVSPGFEDIIHYAYCYIGVLTGPYYSYATFNDYFLKDFYKYAQCENATLKKLTFVPLFAFIFLLVSYLYPIQYATSNEFYTETSFWYRLWYITPVFVTFRMRIYVGMILSEAACTIAGLGAYPTVTEPKPGKGPSVKFELLQELEKTPDLKEKTDFNFRTISNIDTLPTEINPSVRTSIRHWNMSVQYWMAFIVYKRFPNKALRTAATFAVSALWHGIHAGYYLCLCSVPFYLHIEDIWENLVRKDVTGKKGIMINVLFWMVRTQAFSYMGMAFSLLSMENGLRYYKSIYFIYHITSVIGLILGLALTKLLKKNKKVLEEEKKKE